MEVQSVDDLVDSPSLGAEPDADKVELVRGDGGNGGAVRFVVVGGEELAGVDGWRDAAAQRAFKGPPQRRAVSLVDEDRLEQHRQILVSDASRYG